MPRTPPPDYLPAEVLARPDFVKACRQRDLGQILAIAMKYGGPGFTPSHVARRCEMTVSQVQAYVKHRRTAMSMDIFERVADGVHIPGRMLGITRRPWEGEHREPVADSITSGVMPGTAAGGNPAPARAEQEGIPDSDDLESGEDADIMIMLQEADRSDVGPGIIGSVY